MLELEEDVYHSRHKGQKEMHITVLPTPMGSNQAELARLRENQKKLVQALQRLLIYWNDTLLPGIRKSTTIPPAPLFLLLWKQTRNGVSHSCSEKSASVLAPIPVFTTTDTIASRSFSLDRLAQSVQTESTRGRS